MDLCRRSAAREALRSNRASGNPPKCSNFFFPFTLVPDPPAPFIGSSECLRCASLRLQLSWISLGEIGKDSSWNWCMGNRYGTLYFFKIPSNGIPSLVFRFPLNGRDICFPSNEIFPPFFFFLLFFVFFSFCSYIYIYIYIYWKFASRTFEVGWILNLSFLLSDEKTRDTEIHYCTVWWLAATWWLARVHVGRIEQKNWSIISHAGNFFGFAEKHLSCAFHPDDCH